MLLHLANLTNRQLDYAVANAAKFKIVVNDYDFQVYNLDNEEIEFNPTSNWQIAGSIIQTNNIKLNPINNSYWETSFNETVQVYEISPFRTYHSSCIKEHESPLVAAMQTFVMSKFGNNIVIPDSIK